MNIVTALPGITPKGRNYTMGQWPQTQRKMRNGRVVRWAASSKPTGDRMDLSWENITYAQAEELCKVWDDNYGTYGTLTIPPEIVEGARGDLKNLLLLPFPGATWQPAGPPRTTAVKAGRCTVQIPIQTRGHIAYHS
jgi:hypothetical protein